MKFSTTMILCTLIIKPLHKKKPQTTILGCLIILFKTSQEFVKNPDI